MSRAGAVVLSAALLLAACGDEDAATTETSPSPAATPTPTSAAPATASTAPSGRAGVAGVLAGRGDDGSLEVAVWVEGGADRLVVAFDSDDSHTDPAAPIGPEAEAVVTVDGGAVTGVEQAGAVVSGRAAGVDAVAAADGPHLVIRVFAVDLVPRAGTVWVWVEGDGVAYGTAVGSGCDAGPAARPPGLGPTCAEAAAG